MEDYIFLIIAVVISIFAAIKKNKKTEPIASAISENEEEPENYFMDRLFNVDFPEDEEEQIPVRIKPVAKKETLIAPAPMRTEVYYRMPFKSTLPDRSVRTIQSSLKKETATDEETEVETGESAGYFEDFSLRKAFVYSEIMNPKYLQETGS
jgi:hypothetical protein